MWLPVCAGPLRGEIHAVVGVVVLLVHDLAKTEVGDLDLAADVTLGEKDVARLEVVVDHRRLDLVQVLQR